MLQDIRDKVAQGWIAWVIVIAIGIAFTFWGIEGYLMGGGKATNTAAVVDGFKVTQEQLNNTYQRLRREWQAQASKSTILTTDIEKKLKANALTRIINRYLLTQAAQNQGYRVSTQQLDSVLVSLPVFQVKGQFSQERFQQVLSRLMYSAPDFINQLRADLILNQQRVGIIASSFVLPKDVDQAYSLISQQRDFGYTIIPQTRFITQVHIAENAIQAYYKKHRNSFKTPEQVSIEYLKLEIAKLQAGLKFTDVELRQYYQDNIDNYTLPAKWHVAQILIKTPVDANATKIKEAKAKIDAIAKQLKQGVKFNELAKQKSQDIVSAKQGGMLPWFNAGALDPQFEKAVMQLKPGEISPPVRTKYGFNIIKLLAEKKPQTQPFSEVKQKVETILAQQKAQKIFADKNDELANSAFTNPTSLAPAAKALNLTVETTGFFSRKGGKEGLIANPKIVAAAFNPDTLTEGNNSNVIEMGPEKLVVLRVKQHKPAAILSFAEVKEKIKNILTQKEAQQRAEALGKQILKKLENESNPEKITKAQDLTWDPQTKIDRNNKKINAVILESAFKLPEPVSGKLSSMGVVLPSGYAVVTLSKIRDSKLDSMPNEQQKVFKEQLLNSYGQLDYQLYVQQLKQNAKIKIK